MFSSCFYFSIMLLGSLIQKEYQPDKVILSPAMIEEMPYQKVERTIFLSKEDIAVSYTHLTLPTIYSV